ncbi:MAG: hypothetical protein QNJ05_16430 [Woeseiaceae bacterium]|nr:hypothetical protein [Woeseiaceae bacterium]
MNKTVAETTSQTPPKPQSDVKPVKLIDFVDLFSRPAQFFSGKINISSVSILLPVILVVGIGNFIDRIDSRLIRAEFNLGSGVNEAILRIAEGSWAYFWVAAVAGGIVGGALTYYIAGLIYKFRLWLAGARDIDGGLARNVNIYSTLVVSFPTVIIAIVAAFSFDNYYQHFMADSALDVLFLVFPFWSVVVSYIGATTAFELGVWKARFWFLILPTLFYLTVFGGIVWLVAFMQ